MVHSPEAEDHPARPPARPGLVCTRRTIASAILPPAEARITIERLHLTIDVSTFPPAPADDPLELAAFLVGEPAHP